eukprot:5288086-Alexandrium_andersonii.AAC.1
MGVFGRLACVCVCAHTRVRETGGRPFWVHRPPEPDKRQVHALVVLQPADAPGRGRGLEGVA